MTGYTLPYPTSCIPNGGEFGNFDSSRTQPHRGVDFSAYHVDLEGLSRNIPAAADGVVASRFWSDALGNVVVVKHSDGKYTGYCHMSSIAVSAGDKVTRRQKLGVMGETGTAADGIHLHMTMSNDIDGVRWGAVQDPIAYIKAHPYVAPVTVGKPGRTLYTLTTGIPNEAFYKRLQWYAHLNGYTGPIDGKPGVQTWKGVQKGLAKDYGYKGIIDGVPGTLTYKALQAMAHKGGSKDPIDGTLSKADYRGIATRLNLL